MPPSAPPPDLHDYVSFDAPDEHRTWVFDVSFLLSPWRCIYGHGCKGVLTEAAPELEQGCCSYGAHLVDEADANAVLEHADRLTTDQWQFGRLAVRRGGPIRRTPKGQLVTRLVDGACIFLNRPGFAGGAGCALHRAALEVGERPMDWKPDVCWQLPLRLVETTDESGHVTSTLREWKRRDWGAGGAEFHWWCTEAPDAFVGEEPVYVALRDEIVEMVGPWAYDRFVELMRGRAPRSPGRERYLPHPALRRRR
ncbi:MAG TPA: hypothetical protein VE575_04280 [Acidimicrobiales bacterium]|jgi:hypothetical protein|nr:hypothetical protein [Acidimicrobiales bacterium]